MFSSATLPCMSRKPRPDTAKKVPLAARVDPDALAVLQAIADADDRTLSYVVDKAVCEYAERHGKKQTEPKRR